MSCWEARYSLELPRALYIHIPFCERRCFYCDFATRACRPGNPLLQTYVSALSKQIDELSEAGLLDELVSIYVGGGTPSVLGELLVDLCTQLSSCAQVQEFSIEANPESFDATLAANLREAGVGRVSLGVQSLCDEELRALGRIHTAERAREALAAAVRCGLDTSADLMCGIPLQTRTSWRQSVQELIELGVNHVSVYPLVVEDGTAFARLVDKGKLELLDEDFQAQCMLEAAELLEAAAFARYEVASYARPGKACAHNCAYWTGLPYLGLGQAAASMLTPQAYQRFRELSPQLPELHEDCGRVRLVQQAAADEFSQLTGLAETSYELEELSEREMLAEDLMLAARMSEGLSPDLLSYAQEHLGKEQLDGAVKDARARGLVEESPDGGLVPTAKGWLCGNDLYGIFWDLAL